MRLASGPGTTSFGAAAPALALKGAPETRHVCLPLAWTEVHPNLEDDILTDQYQDLPRTDAHFLGLAMSAQFPGGVGQQNLYGQQGSLGFAMDLSDGARAELDAADRPLVGPE